MARHLIAVAAVAFPTLAAVAMITVAAAPPEQPRHPASQPATNPAVAKPVDRMIEAARRRTESALASHRFSDDEEEVYRWSERLMRLEREAAADPAGRRAAVTAHLDRMRQQLERVKRFMYSDDKGGEAGGAVAKLTFRIVVSHEFYVAEAEHWLAEMDAAQQKLDAAKQGK